MSNRNWFKRINRRGLGELGVLRIYWERFFNRDFPMGPPYGITFKYYGGTWRLKGDHELYWISAGNKENLTYKSWWNSADNDFQSMVYIMENHPNLIEPRENLTVEDYTPIIIKP